ncbi:hypothetical protein [Pseudomonas mosselii]|uniref:hypothetical protein n=1 Tax=Pseudomonas mosselii TaxID=78327 RepID=UPI0021DAAD59|nr:hypothetical protein [Pseudomonas mosselii]MCU9528540.1 hypothetical protein [Pseudomonas mosselii]MCU9535874.1 hypothetical protein [Pseudomonas mosselii]MCU9542932.1 hypothetical protein [Pseudomonas mosselii]MCU9548813.1 hypothetical protein [Pseudomonas mosselii]
MSKSICNMLNIRNSVTSTVFSLKRKLMGPVDRLRLVLVFVFFASTITSERPMKLWLVKPTYVAVLLAKYAKWVISGFSLYVYIFHGIQSPLWLTAAGVVTGEVLSVAIAAAEMEMKHYGYLNS